MSPVPSLAMPLRPHWYLISFLFTSAGLLAGKDIPFVLPWDDVSDNATNLAHTLHQPAGKFGWIGTAPDGTYRVSGERIRFYGVNIGAGSCFPPLDKAEAIAARLARMGLNVARFHHMEAPWTDGLLAYESGNSRTFDPVRLDRLDFFLAALKEAGVYLNLNLLTSREFQAGDGLPQEIESIDWKVQHVLAMFYPQLVALQKEHARGLLERVNPYTGLRYADDPALAFVEINNENGILHAWYGGDLDGLPAVFETPFRQRWNQWLREKYGDTETLRHAWGAVDDPPGPELLTNGDFSAGTTGWNAEQHQGAQAGLETGVFGGQAGARLTVSATGSADWHVQLFNPGFPVTMGQLYTVRFRARADEAVDVRLVVSMAHDPWQNLGLNTTISLTETWQDFNFTFYGSADDDQARFGFSGLGSRSGSMDLAAVSLHAGGTIDPVPENTGLEAGTVPIMETGSDSLPPSRRDWMAFLRDLETEYWTGMNRFIKEDIGFPGITWGTTIMNSLPSVQARFDAIDTHSYWKHPVFPGNPWDPVNWYVENESMVNDSDAGALGQLFQQRIAGYPHNVTEYQHSGPNTYSSEAPLFLAFYGALQDWDGLYLFHYGSDSDDWDRGIYNGFFDIDQHPAKLINTALGSLIFRRGDVATTKNVVRVPFDLETELEVLVRSGTAWNVANLSHLNVPPEIGLVQRLEMVLEPEVGPLPDTFPEFDETPVYTSRTGELVWNRSDPDAGFVTLDAPRAKGFIGFDAGRTFELGEVRLNPGDTEQGWLTFVAVMLEGAFDQPSVGGRGLIATTGLTENTNMQWTDETRISVGNQWGRAPTLVERVPVELVLPFPAERVQVWALDERGDRLGGLTIEDQSGQARVTLGGESASIWYEFSAASESAPVSATPPQAIRRETRQVTLDWEEVPGAWRYRVEQSLDGGLSWEEQAVVDSGSTHILLGGLPTGTEILFRISAENDGGSSMSNPASIWTRQTYSEWAATHFLDVLFPNGEHPDHWLADPDGDRIPNGLESVFGTSPLSPSPLPNVDVSMESGISWWVPVNAMAEHVATLQMEVSHDMASWSRMPPIADTGDALKFSLPDPGPRPLFWRFILDPDS